MWKYVWTKALAPAILVGVLTFGTSASAACINWSDAKSVIAKNRLMKPATVRSRAMRRGGEVISMNLCRRGGRYVYRMTVIGKKKRVRDVVVDARSGGRVGGRSGKVSSDKKLERRIIKRVRRNLRRHGINAF